jgi:hypothetical protein
MLLVPKRVLIEDLVVRLAEILGVVQQEESSIEWGCFTVQGSLLSAAEIKPTVGCWGTRTV